MSTQQPAMADVSRKRESLDVSLTSNDGPERKRRRKVLSCWDCRRRKLQCDRAMPACGRCTKAGKVASCLYIDDAHSEAAQQANTSTSQGPQLGACEVLSNGQGSAKDQRIAQLEAALAQTGQFPRVRGQPDTPASTIGAATAFDRECMVLRGRSFKTKYFGSTNPCGPITYIPDMNNITREAFEAFPQLRQMRSDIRQLEEKLGKDILGSARHEHDDLQTLLPQREEVDELVQLYIHTFESLYHIHHMPTFWKNYEEMWTSSAKPDFVAVVLLMMACVCCISHQPQRYIAQSSVARNKSLLWIASCEDWIRRQSQKHVTATHFQARCLLWLAQACNERKVKRTWTEAGTLLRICMSAGLHRNPDLLQKETSAADKELRRRIWATAVDFELQASFDRGMVSAPWLLQSDCPGPSNWTDEDILKDKPPPPRPGSDYTPSSYLSLAHGSLMLRSTLNAVLNNIRQTLSFDEVKHYTDEIEDHLSCIPDWQEDRCAMAKGLLTLRLQQYLIALHDRHLRSATSQAERSFSKGVIFNTALQIVEIHKSLVARGNHTLELYCLDPIRTAVSVAHLQACIDPRTDLVLSKTFDTLAFELLEDIVELVQDKFYRFGRDCRTLWITLVCEAVMKTRRQPEQKSVWIKQAVDKVINPMYKIMACQDPTASVGAAAQLDGTDTVRQDDGPDTTSGGSISDVALFEVDAMDDWTFHDWFSNTDFQAMGQPGQDLFDRPTPTEELGA